jgi:uncharacterized protein (DUF427 family)
MVATGMAAGHQITITPANAHIEVTLDGQKLAESDRAVVLHEAGLLARYYIPADDVCAEVLPPARRTTWPVGKGATRRRCSCGCSRNFLRW